ncbi:MAG: helix-turn-helix transcriptional regulator [Campylobacterota bacterium]|nr:helix-turn-helix transcriptional regulator [Campylobacterota bacterium]
MRLHEIGKTIKELRKEKKLTQEELSNIAGISRVTLGKIEKGYFGVVSIKTLDIILSSLGYEIDIKILNGFGLTNLDDLS